MLSWNSVLKLKMTSIAGDDPATNNMLNKIDSKTTSLDSLHDRESSTINLETDDNSNCISKTDAKESKESRTGEKEESKELRTREKDICTEEKDDLTEQNLLADKDVICETIEKNDLNKEDGELSSNLCESDGDFLILSESSLSLSDISSESETSDFHSNKNKNFTNNEQIVLSPKLSELQLKKKNLICQLVEKLNNKEEIENFERIIMKAKHKKRSKKRKEKKKLKKKKSKKSQIKCVAEQELASCEHFSLSNVLVEEKNDADNLFPTLSEVTSTASMLLSDVFKEDSSPNFDDSEQRKMLSIDESFPKLAHFDARSYIPRVRNISPKNSHHLRDKSKSPQRTYHSNHRTLCPKKIHHSLYSSSPKRSHHFRDSESPIKNLNSKHSTYPNKKPHSRQSTSPNKSHHYRYSTSPNKKHHSKSPNKIHHSNYSTSLYKSHHLDYSTSPNKNYHSKYSISPKKSHHSSGKSDTIKVSHLSPKKCHYSRDRSLSPKKNSRERSSSTKGNHSAKHGCKKHRRRSGSVLLIESPGPSEMNHSSNDRSEKHRRSPSVLLMEPPVLSEMSLSGSIPFVCKSIPRDSVAAKARGRRKTRRHTWLSTTSSSSRSSSSSSSQSGGIKNRCREKEEIIHIGSEMNLQDIEATPLVDPPPQVSNLYDPAICPNPLPPVVPSPQYSCPPADAVTSLPLAQHNAVNSIAPHPLVHFSHEQVVPCQDSSSPRVSFTSPSTFFDNHFIPNQTNKSDHSNTSNYDEVSMESVSTLSFNEGDINFWMNNLPIHRENSKTRVNSSCPGGNILLGNEQEINLNNARSISVVNTNRSVKKLPCPQDARNITNLIEPKVCVRSDVSNKGIKAESFSSESSTDNVAPTTSGSRNREIICDNIEPEFILNNDSNLNFFSDDADKFLSELQHSMCVCVHNPTYNPTISDVFLIEKWFALINSIYHDLIYKKNKNTLSKVQKYQPLFDFFIDYFKDCKSKTGPNSIYSDQFPQYITRLEVLNLFLSQQKQHPSDEKMSIYIQKNGIKIKNFLLQKQLKAQFQILPNQVDSNSTSTTNTNKERRNINILTNKINSMCKLKYGPNCYEMFEKISMETLTYFLKRVSCELQKSEADPYILKCQELIQKKNELSSIKGFLEKLHEKVVYDKNSVSSIEIDQLTHLKDKLFSWGGTLSLLKQAQEIFEALESLHPESSDQNIRNEKIITSGPAKETINNDLNYSPAPVSILKKPKLDHIDFNINNNSFSNSDNLSKETINEQGSNTKTVEEPLNLDQPGSNTSQSNEITDQYDNHKRSHIESSDSQRTMTSHLSVSDTDQSTANHIQLSQNSMPSNIDFNLIKTLVESISALGPNVGWGKDSVINTNQSYLGSKTCTEPSQIRLNLQSCTLNDSNKLQNLENNLLSLVTSNLKHCSSTKSDYSCSTKVCNQQLIINKDKQYTEKNYDLTKAFLQNEKLTPHFGNLKKPVSRKTSNKELRIDISIPYKLQDYKDEIPNVRYREQLIDGFNVLDPRLQADKKRLDREMCEKKDKIIDLPSKVDITDKQIKGNNIQHINSHPMSKKVQLKDPRVQKSKEPILDQNSIINSNRTSIEEMLCNDSSAWSRVPFRSSNKETPLLKQSTSFTDANNINEKRYYDGNKSVTHSSEIIKTSTIDFTSHPAKEDLIKCTNTKTYDVIGKTTAKKESEPIKSSGANEVRDNSRESCNCKEKNIEKEKKVIFNEKVTGSNVETSNEIILQVNNSNNVVLEQPKCNLKAKENANQVSKDRVNCKDTKKDDVIVKFTPFKVSEPSRSNEEKFRRNSRESCKHEQNNRVIVHCEKTSKDITEANKNCNNEKNIIIKTKKLSNSKTNLQFIDIFNKVPKPSRTQDKNNITDFGNQESLDPKLYPKSSCKTNVQMKKEGLDVQMENTSDKDESKSSSEPRKEELIFRNKKENSQKSTPESSKSASLAKNIFMETPFLKAFRNDPKLFKCSVVIKTNDQKRYFEKYGVKRKFYALQLNEKEEQVLNKKKKIEKGRNNNTTFTRKVSLYGDTCKSVETAYLQNDDNTFSNNENKQSTKEIVNKADSICKAKNSIRKKCTTKAHDENYHKESNEACSTKTKRSTKKASVIIENDDSNTESNECKKPCSTFSNNENKPYTKEIVKEGYTNCNAKYPIRKESTTKVLDEKHHKESNKECSTEIKSTTKRCAIIETNDNTETHESKKLFSSFSNNENKQYVTQSMHKDTICKAKNLIRKESTTKVLNEKHHKESNNVCSTETKNTTKRVYAIIETDESDDSNTETNKCKKSCSNFYNNENKSYIKGIVNKADTICKTKNFIRKESTTEANDDNYYKESNNVCSTKTKNTTEKICAIIETDDNTETNEGNKSCLLPSNNKNKQYTRESMNKGDTICKAKNFIRKESTLKAHDENNHKESNVECSIEAKKPNQKVCAIIKTDDNTETNEGKILCSSFSNNENEQYDTESINKDTICKVKILVRKESTTKVLDEKHHKEFNKECSTEIKNTTKKDCAITKTNNTEVGQGKEEFPSKIIDTLHVTKRIANNESRENVSSSEPECNVQVRPIETSSNEESSSTKNEDSVNVNLKEVPETISFCIPNDENKRSSPISSASAECNVETLKNIPFPIDNMNSHSERLVDSMKLVKKNEKYKISDDTIDSTTSEIKDKNETSKPRKLNVKNVWNRIKRQVKNSKVTSISKALPNVSSGHELQKEPVDYVLKSSLENTAPQSSLEIQSTPTSDDKSIPKVILLKRYSLDCKKGNSNDPKPPIKVNLKRSSEDSWVQIKHRDETAKVPTAQIKTTEKSFVEIGDTIDSKPTYEMKKHLLKEPGIIIETTSCGQQLSRCEENEYYLDNPEPHQRKALSELYSCRSDTLEREFERISEQVDCSSSLDISSEPKPTRPCPKSRKHKSILDDRISIADNYSCNNSVEAQDKTIIFIDLVDDSSEPANNSSDGNIDKDTLSSDVPSSHLKKKPKKSKLGKLNIENFIKDNTT